MSFSSEIKEELCRDQAADPEARKAELCSILYYLGFFTDRGCGAESARGSFPDAESPAPADAVLSTDQVLLAKKGILLLKDVCGLRAELEIKTGGQQNRNRQYRIRIPRQAADALRRETEAFLEEPEDGSAACRAWLRGAFLALGSISNPEKSYHLEWILKQEKEAKKLVAMASCFEIDARITRRKGRFVVYLKDSTDIVDMLNVMGAHNSLMQMENVRIMKEMRNSVNRQFNCDTANIRKMVRAAGKQLEDIRLIEARMGIDRLPPQLAQMARVRLEYPDVSLQELGEYLDPPVGKSGVNHRLRKISAIAEDLRLNKREHI